MEETDRLIAEIGLLLTQVRFARRALEDIERETATYGTFAFTSVIAAGKRFGEPPLIDGALKVYVVNINDLGPGGGFGSLIAGLLGGAGSFVGNLLGGIPGGFLASLKLVEMLPTIDSIAGKIERILTLLGVGAPAAPGQDERGGPVGGSNLITMLGSINKAVTGLTGLFTAAGGQPDEAAKVSRLPSTPEGERWQRFLETTTTTLGAVGRVADGLVVMLPIAVGSIASLIYRLADMRVAIAETLQFVLRNALLLRGSLLVTIFDTLALVARIAAQTIELLATTLSDMLSVVFDTVRESLLAVFTLAGVLGDAIKSTIDALLDWLVPTLDRALVDIGNLRVFRLVTHLVQILPAILPPIYALKTGGTLPDENVTKALTKAAGQEFPGVIAGSAGVAPGAAPPGAPPAAPDIGKLIDEKARGPLTGALNRIQDVTTMGLQLFGETGKAGFTTLAQRLDKATIEETKLSDTRLDKNLADVRTQSTSLAANLIVPEKIEPQTGLEAIAKAYEGWLTSGNGLQTLLGTITRHFSSAEGSAGVPQKIVEGSLDRPRATIKIDEVVIELEAAPEGVPQPLPSDYGPGDFPLPPEGDEVERFARMMRDFRLRGGRLDLLPALV